MTYILAGAFGFLASLAAHDLAAQALRDRALRPMAGTCPQCGTTRGWATRYCPACGRRIGREAFLAIAAVLAASAFFNTLGIGWALIAYSGFLLLTLALGITDIDAMRIVDRLNLRGSLLLVLLLAAGAFADGMIDSLWRGLLGAAAYFVGTNLLFLAVRGRGFGYGDVKLSVQLGLFTAYISWGTLGWAVFATALIGGFVSIGVIVLDTVNRRRLRAAGGGSGEQTVRDVMRRELPYGPAMIAGAWMAIFLAGIGAFPIPS